MRIGGGTMLLAHPGRRGPVGARRAVVSGCDTRAVGAYVGFGPFFGIPIISWR